MNDFEGNEILPSNFIEIFTLASSIGLIAARDAGFWDVYDFNGNKINSDKFDYVYPYYGLFGLTKVRVGENWGLLNKFGQLVVPIKFKKIEKFGKGLLLQNFDLSLDFVEKHDLFKLSMQKFNIVENKLKEPLHRKIINIATKKSKTI
jgi:hypothetical protein